MCYDVCPDGREQSLPSGERGVSSFCYGSFIEGIENCACGRANSE
mgnify:CR=1 FL=1